MRQIDLPLHSGKAPYWLLNRMKKLAEPIVALIISDFGELEFLRRISDPIFFQCFSNVLGFDWNSSGSTTVLTGVLKSVLNENEFGVKIAGGKGANAIKTPEEVEKLATEIKADAEKIIKFSRFAAKADNAALIDGYDLYHHAVFFSDKYMVVVQQGMNVETGMARRYHWNVYRNLPSLEDVHSGITAEKIEDFVVNLQSKVSRGARKVCVDVIRDGSFKKDYERLISIVKSKEGLEVPKKIDWRVVEKAYNLQPENFENLLMIKGIGKETIRALALISELIYSTEYDKKDPAKFCFAVGGKDGVPFPVRREIYDEVIKFMRETLKQAELGDFERKAALERLSRWKS
ncbi:MAG: DUF763 domain-containing protein [Archaeoglobales archaeon]|nr:DUF763 domain-containing protein [Archaeoglobales archaeon]